MHLDNKVQNTTFLTNWFSVSKIVMYPIIDFFSKDSEHETVSYGTGYQQPLF